VLVSRLLKYLPEEFYLAVAAAAHLYVFRKSRWAGLVSFAIVSAAIVVHIPRLNAMLPPHQWVHWARGVGLGWGVATLGIALALAAVRFFDRFAFQNAPFHPGRRKFLQVAEGLAVAAPVGVIGFGFIIGRKALDLREVPVKIPGLPKDLDGIRVVQLTDLHRGPFLTGKELAAVIDMANSARPHIAVVTGDLITREGDPLDACLKELSRLRADAGVYGCLGNHEIYAACEKYVAEQGQRLGIRFLRERTEQLRFGAACINLAGVDYQRLQAPYLVRAGSLVSRQPGTVNVLLSHNPDVFRTAAAQGWDLTVAGHTHGGQVNVEILDQHLNVARFYTSYVYGLYTEGPASIYVSRGVGTVGVPVRLGAPPEVALIRLCAT
jgi:hypothetical protein